MANYEVVLINESNSDFHQGGCLYKLTSGIQFILEQLWTSDRSQKKTSQEADQSSVSSGVVVIS